LFAVTLVAPNTPFILATILAIIPVITSIITAILTSCIRDDKVTFSKGWRFIPEFNGCKGYATCQS
jgi:hypothetical protein